MTQQGIQPAQIETRDMAMRLMRVGCVNDQMLYVLTAITELNEYLRSVGDDPATWTGVEASNVQAAMNYLKEKVGELEASLQ